MHLLFDYLSTLIVSLLLIGLVVLIIYRMRKDKNRENPAVVGIVDIAKWVVTIMTQTYNVCK